MQKGESPGVLLFDLGSCVARRDGLSFQTMTAIAERIFDQIGSLPEKDQEEVLRELWEKWHDQRAKKIYDSVKAGEETREADVVISELREKYDL